MSAFTSSLLRATARKSLSPCQTRLISCTRNRQNEATAVPLAETMRSVARRAQQGVVVKAGEEGFKAGVLATLLGGSALAAGYLIMAPSAGAEVNGNELL